MQQHANNKCCIQLTCEGLQCGSQSWDPSPPGGLGHHFSPFHPANQCRHPGLQAEHYTTKKVFLHDQTTSCCKPCFATDPAILLRKTSATMTYMSHKTWSVYLMQQDYQYLLILRLGVDLLVLHSPPQTLPHRHLHIARSPSGLAAN